MKNDYYQTLDENFNEALNLIEKPMQHEELINLLKTGNIPQKQLAALRLEFLSNSDDAKILLNNLIGQDGKIREAVSLKIKEFISDDKYLKIFNSLDMNILSDYFLTAIIDINGNICRNILDTIIYMKFNKNFTNLFTEKLTKLINELLNKIEQFDYKDGKYKVNKEVFKLYWCLEAVYIYADLIPQEKLAKILAVTKDIDEYTIREKTAKILSNINNIPELEVLKSELSDDENYYVRRALKNS